MSSTLSLLSHPSYFLSRSGFTPPPFQDNYCPFITLCRRNSDTHVSRLVGWVKRDGGGGPNASEAACVTHLTQFYYPLAGWRAQRRYLCRSLPCYCHLQGFLLRSSPISRTSSFRNNYFVKPSALGRLVSIGFSNLFLFGTSKSLTFILKKIEGIHTINDCR